MYECKCGRIFEKVASLGGHSSHCKIHNPEGKRKTAFPLDKCGWSKGLTKDSSELVAKSSNTLKAKIASGEYVPKGTPHSEDTKNYLSELRTTLLENNEGHCKWYSISNGEMDIKVQGGWEKIVAETMTILKIKWERKVLVYNKIKRYTPDFYLPDYNIYLEVKGWWKDRDIEKTELVLNEHSIDLRVIDNLKQIKEIEKRILDIHSLKKYASVAELE